MCGISPAHNVARVFDNRVLESSAGAKERNAVFPRVAYSDKRAFGVFIGAGGNHPDSIVISEIVSGFYFAGGQPVITQRQLQYGGGIINRQGNRFMGNYIRVVITNQGNTQGEFIAGSLCQSEYQATQGASG
jgi:hypothetical protein